MLASVAIHGGVDTPVNGWYGRRAARETLVEERESTAAGLFGHHEGEVQRITPEELNRLPYTAYSGLPLVISRCSWARPSRTYFGRWNSPWWVTPS